MRSGLLSNSGIIAAEDEAVGVNIVTERCVVYGCTGILSRRGVIPGKNKTIAVNVAKENAHRASSINSLPVIIQDCLQLDGGVLRIRNTGQLDCALIGIGSGAGNSLSGHAATGDRVRKCEHQCVVAVRAAAPAFDAAARRRKIDIEVSGRAMSFTRHNFR